jgi:nanoRNase/pAp phosphatase (c-di-AMP/oligoRNAs hydrolase)
MKERLDLLLKAVGAASQFLLLPHNDPDPDAIASTVALRYLLAETVGVDSHIAYRGIIGRAENKALVHYLDRPLHRLTSVDLHQDRPIALLDTQPGAGNNALPAHRTATIVIDHHPCRDETSGVAFADVRPHVGSTSTILTEYLRAAEIEPPPELATALFYGIKADTLGLVRGASPEDLAAYSYLQPQIEVEALVEIERAQVPTEYFQRMDATLHAARIYQDVVIAYVGPMLRPDLAAEMADLLLRLKGMKWAICMGVYKGGLILAVRSLARQGGAGQLAQVMVDGKGTAGGHGTMAGGQIPLQGADPEQVAQQLSQMALSHLLVPEKAAGRPLMD